MDVNNGRLGTARMIAGLAAAAMAGLVSFIVLTLSVDLLRFGVASAFFGHEWRDPQVFSRAAFYLFFGCPLALLFSFAIGLPVWKHAESKPLRSRGDALRIGAAVGAAIGFLLLLANFVSGLLTYLNPNASYDGWTYGYQVTRDGLPTLIGWLFELLNVVYFSLAGAVGGLVARWVGLPR